MFNVYVIQNDNQKIYIGYTGDLEKRLARHNQLLKSKESSYTHKNSGNWRVIYTEIYSTRAEAMKREKELKSYQGRMYIKKIIENMDR